MKNTIETLENYLDHVIEQLNFTQMWEGNYIVSRNWEGMENNHRLSVTKNAGGLISFNIEHVEGEIEASVYFWEGKPHKTMVGASTHYLKNPAEFDRVVRAFAPALDELIQEFKTKYKL